MAKESRTHHSDEFGKSTSGAIGGFDPPMIGAPGSILTDGLVERESGVTPSPWSLSLKGIVISLVVMLVIGALLLVVATKIQPWAMRQQEMTTIPTHQ